MTFVVFNTKTYIFCLWPGNTGEYVVDVLLIHPPNRFDAETCVRSAMPVEVVGYGLLSVAAFLQDNGYSVRVVDVPHLFQQNFNRKEILSLLNSYDPELIGIELNWLHFSRGALELARELKNAHPNIPLVMGGVHASLFKEEILSSYGQWVDHIIVGEGEAAMLSFLEKKNESCTFLEIDQIPPYDPAVLVPKREGTFMMLNTCRGQCMYSCLYCIGNRIGQLTGRTTFSRHSPAWICEQVQIFRERGYTEIGLQDPWMGGENADRFLDSLVKTFKEEQISDQLKRINMVSLPGTLNREQLRNLAAAGFTDIDYGCESGSQRVLETVQRPASPQMIQDAVKATAEEGIIPMTYWMTGFPRETGKDVSLTAQLIRAVINRGGIPHWVTPLVILPGTSLYERAAEFGVVQKLHTFEDFAAFSEMKRKPWAWYPELLSHYTEEQSAEEILMNSIQLKLTAINCREEILAAVKPLEKKLYDRHPEWAEENRLYRSIDFILKRLKGSYF